MEIHVDQPVLQGLKAADGAAKLAAHAQILGGDIEQAFAEPEQIGAGAQSGERPGPFQHLRQGLRGVQTVWVRAAHALKLNSAIACAVGQRQGFETQPGGGARHHKQGLLAIAIGDHQKIIDVGRERQLRDRAMQLVAAGDRHGPE